MALADLDDKDLAVYKDWQEKKNRPSLALSLSLQLFELFLHGLTVREIVEMNKNTYRYEQVIEARVRDDWDGRRRAHLDNLFGSIYTKVTQAQAEAASFLTDMLAVAHKQHGTGLKTYLQTGDDKDLAGIQIQSWQGYKSVVESLMKLTGQDKPKDLSPSRPSPPPESGKVEPGPEIKMLPAGAVRVMDTSAALKILGVVTEEKK